MQKTLRRMEVLLLVLLSSCSLIDPGEEIYIEKREGDPRGLLFTYYENGAYGVDPETLEVKWIIRGSNPERKPYYPVKSQDGRIFVVPSQFRDGAPPNDTIVVIDNNGRVIKRWRPFPPYTIGHLILVQNILFLLYPFGAFALLNVDDYSVVKEITEVPLDSTRSYNANHIINHGRAPFSDIRIDIGKNITITSNLNYYPTNKEGSLDPFYTLIGDDAVVGLDRTGELWVWDMKTADLRTNFYITNYLSSPTTGMKVEGGMVWYVDNAHTIVCEIVEENEAGKAINVRYLYFDSSTFAFLREITHPNGNIPPEHFQLSALEKVIQNKMYFVNYFETSNGIFCFDLDEGRITKSIPWPSPTRPRRTR
ncbi:hypothetical protein [Thermospira aquatica]|uniref:DUF5050 domain-containing protein n=1 Tax=Thermospira aquatica TaxID=2828656 RepID=A0AAX3BAE4_9SPIR|nr:hypothetical protein [Thermospira aquatica]URA09105.1 hypothetical protein KDW03_06245 [Thermospira aquatica]